MRTLLQDRMRRWPARNREQLIAMFKRLAEADRVIATLAEDGDPIVPILTVASLAMDAEDDEPT